MAPNLDLNMMVNWIDRGFNGNLLIMIRLLAASRTEQSTGNIEHAKCRRVIKRSSDIYAFQLYQNVKTNTVEIQITDFHIYWETHWQTWGLEYVNRYPFRLHYWALYFLRTTLEREAYSLLLPAGLEDLTYCWHSFEHSLLVSRCFFHQ